MEAVKNLNGEMWIFASLLIAIVVIQACWFLRLALKYNKKHNYFTKEEVGHLLKMGSVSVLGPAFSVVVVAISLIAMVGSGLTFMRVGVIGAAGYEMMIATTAAETIGVQFNTPEFNESVLVLCGFGMAFASIPYFISTPIELMIMDKAAAKAGGKAKDKPSFIPYLGKAAMMGLMGSFAVSYLASPINWVAFLTAARCGNPHYQAGGKNREERPHGLVYYHCHALRHDSGPDRFNAHRIRREAVWKIWKTRCRPQNSLPGRNTIRNFCPRSIRSAPQPWQSR